MFFGLMTVGAAILFFTILLIRVASTVYNRDIDPYIRNKGSSPIFQSESNDDDDFEVKPYAQFVNEYNDRRQSALKNTNTKFLKTELGKSYIRILNGTNK